MQSLKINSINTSLNGFNTFDVKISSYSNKNGNYPFEIDGEFPTYVSKIDESCLSNVNVKVGDYIININGQNVSRASAKSVQKIIKSSNELNLVLSRPKLNPKVNKSQVSSSPKRICLVKREINSLIKCFKNFKICEQQTENANETIPYVSKTASTFVAYNQTNIDRKMDSDDCGYYSIPRTDGSQPSLTSIGQDNDFNNINSSIESSLHSLNVAHEENISFDDLKQEILEKSEEFLSKIQVAIEAYVRPIMALKLISKSQYLRLFQNMEKLIPVTKFMFSIITQTDLNNFALNLGKFNIVFETYETYVFGLPLAIQLFEELLRYNNEFNQFVRSNKDLLSIDLVEFLFLPFHFIRRICGLLNYVVDETALNADLKILSQMGKCLHKTDNLLNEIFCDKYDQATELDYSDATTCTNNMTQLSATIIEDKLLVKRNHIWTKCSVKLVNDRLIIDDYIIKMDDIKSVTNTNNLDLHVKIFQSKEAELLRIKFRFSNETKKRLWLKYLNFDF
jgi:hypothetical protein